MNDILSKKDIIIFVDSFYGKVKKDELLGGVFAAKIPDENWQPHLERMYNFWNTVLFSKPEYSGNPFSKHTDLPIEESHFTRWITLFTETIDEHFVGTKAEEVKMRALKMSILFQSKLTYLKEHQGFKNIV